jgi:hypothetical protein
MVQVPVETDDLMEVASGMFTALCIYKSWSADHLHLDSNPGDPVDAAFVADPVETPFDPPKQPTSSYPLSGRKPSAHSRQKPAGPHVLHWHLARREWPQDRRVWTVA